MAKIIALETQENDQIVNEFINEFRELLMKFREDLVQSIKVDLGVKNLVDRVSKDASLAKELGENRYANFSVRDFDLLENLCQQTILRLEEINSDFDNLPDNLDHHIDFFIIPTVRCWGNKTVEFPKAVPCLLAILVMAHPKK